MTKQVRLLLVDDPGEYSTAISEQVDLCKHEFDIDIKVVPSEANLMDEVKSWGATVVLMDPLAYGTRGMDILGLVSSASCEVIALSQGRTPEIEATLKRSGAVACVQVTDDPDDLHNLLQRIADLAPELKLVQ